MSDAPVVVRLLRRMSLPLTAREQARINVGEECGVSPADAADLLANGYAVRPGEPDLDETHTVVACKAAFRFRGIDRRVGDLVNLPTWFVLKARADGRVGDVPLPDAAPQMSSAAKLAIEHRRVARQRAVAHHYLESLS
jgi:hypothetical protein